VLGLARLPAASSSLLLNLEAVFTLAIAVVVGREHLGRRGLISADPTVAGAVVLSQGSLSGSTWWGACLIALATLAWAIDNNLSQRLSQRDPLQIASLKAAGASLPMLALAPAAWRAVSTGARDGTDTVSLLNTWMEGALGVDASALKDSCRGESFGAEAWPHDPEGNRLLLLVLP
jgi:drug/metabolite transporter (DMT)-like permease